MEELGLSKKEFERLSKRKQAEYYLERLSVKLTAKYKGNKIKFKNETTRTMGVKLQSLYLEMENTGVVMIHHDGLENLLDNEGTKCSCVIESAKEVVNAYNEMFKEKYGHCIIKIT